MTDDYDFIAPPMYDDEVGWTELAKISGLSDQRLKALVREGKIPSSVKNKNGHWRFSLAAVEAFFAERVRPSKTEGKMWKIRVRSEHYATVKDLLAGYGIELEPAYKSKQVGEGEDDNVGGPDELDDTDFVSE